MDASKILEINPTIIFHILNFVILLFAFKYFFSGKVGRLIEERKKIIEKDINEAKQNNIESLSIKEKIEEELDRVRLKSREIVNETMHNAKITRKNILAEAEESKNKMIEEAKVEMNRMKDSLKKEVLKYTAELSVKISEKIIKSELNTDSYSTLLNEEMDKLEKKL